MKIGSNTSKVNPIFSRNSTTLNINNTGVKSSMHYALKNEIGELDEL